MPVFMIYNIGEFYFNQTGKQETGLKTVNTVLGPLETAKIGFTLMHDHIMGSASGIPQVYPELLGKDYKKRIIKGLTAAKKAGINTIVDADTFDLGRAVKILSEVSQASGVNIVCCSGWFGRITGLSRAVFPPTSSHKYLPERSRKGLKGPISKQASSNPPRILAAGK